MFFDLTTRPLKSDAYSTQPFTFLEQSAHRDIGNIAAINLIENGDRVARNHWQNRQLANLLKHAQARSGFWRKRIPTRPISSDILQSIPNQSRADVVTQVQQEGSLTGNGPNGPATSYASTGSTGTPVKVFICPENGYYNNMRSVAQYFINGLSLAENRVLIAPTGSLAKLQKNALDVTRTDSWAGPLSGVFRNGSAKKINYKYDDDALVRELLKEPVGYLVSPNRYVDILLKKGGVDLIRKLGLKVWMHLSDYRDPDIVETLKGVGVRSLSNYSAAETGPIAFECLKHEGYFHVAHTNVIVESDRKLTALFNGILLGRLLITHLHSYATPIIRYDVGDLGTLETKCPCGHDGPTISNIFGRGKHFLRHPDGRLVPFHLPTRLLQEAIDFKDCRIRQTVVDTITVEIGGRQTITANEEENLKVLIVKATDPAFNIKIIPVNEIEWPEGSKRLLFSSTLA